MVAIALLGSAGLASTWSGPLRRSSAGKHKHLMSHGVPESLMHANITAGYADTFCKTFVPSNLTTQHWVDEPMCQRANTTFKVPPIFLHASFPCLHMSFLQAHRMCSEAKHFLKRTRASRMLAGMLSCDCDVGLVLLQQIIALWHAQHLQIRTP